MSSIYCSVCKQKIEEDYDIIEVRLGFVEHGDFTPEEIFYYHGECNPLDITPNKDQ